MSQQNNNYPPPSFNYSIDGPYFEPQSSSSASFTQWPQPASRSVGNTGSSPVPSVRNPIATSNQRTAPRMNINPPGLLQRDNRSELNNALLTVPTVSRVRPVDMNTADPIARFYNDAPWSSEHMRNSSRHPLRASFNQPNLDYGTYRDGPGSEAESIAPRSDSGYYTHHAHSVISNEPERADQELPSDMTFGVSNINVGSTPSEPAEPFRIQPDQTSQYSGRSGTQREFKCMHCREISKCRSDHKKHMLKHDKPFKCDIPNCRRNGKGFTTVNDLARHKKSVHRIGALQNSYQCASENCRNREKIWPRLDNFKQHINRMHRDEDEQELIRRSVYHPPEAPTAEVPSVAPMDTTLAGIGTERQFAGNDFDEPTSGISLTPDQDTSHWTFSDPISHSFALDVDHANQSLYTRIPRKLETNPGSKVQGQLISMTPNVASGNLSRGDSHRLDALADLASTQASPDRPAPQRLPQLSNAPQTKADQQRQALQTLSKSIARNIQSSSTDDVADLESVVLRVLYGAVNRKRPAIDKSRSTDSEALEGIDMEKETFKASQVIANLLQQDGKSTNSRTRQQPRGGFHLNMKTCECCGATLARSCDMKKHMKRHTKPYGCTYPKCHKRFGAKSDWKRHENGQHFQLESFRCQLTSPSSQTPCGELFYRAEMFKNHLQSHHKVDSPEQVAHEVKMRRIGKNGQGRFWCGFCQQIVPLEKKRIAAWDERFDHIDYHFNKEKRSIEEWLCVEAKKTKGEVLRDIDRTSFDEDDMDLYGLDETDNGPLGAEHDRQDSKAQMLAPQTSIPSSEVLFSRSKKRQATNEAPGPSPPQKQSRRDIIKYCCECQNGPWATNMYSNCLNCQHQWCINCGTGALVELESGIMQSM